MVQLNEEFESHMIRVTTYLQYAKLGHTISDPAPKKPILPAQEPQTPNTPVLRLPGSSETKDERRTRIEHNTILQEQYKLQLTSYGHEYNAYQNIERKVAKFESDNDASIARLRECFPEAVWRLYLHIKNARELVEELRAHYQTTTAASADMVDWQASFMNVKLEHRDDLGCVETFVMDIARYVKHYVEYTLNLGEDITTHKNTLMRTVLGVWNANLPDFALFHDFNNRAINTNAINLWLDAQTFIKEAISLIIHAKRSASMQNKK